MEDQLITAISTIAGAVLTWVLYRLSGYIEAKIAATKTERDDLLLARLKDVTSALVIKVHQELSTKDGKARASAVANHLTVRYSGDIAKIGLSEDQVQDLVKGVYEQLKSSSNRLSDVPSQTQK